jgi:hypothetical protein
VHPVRQCRATVRGFRHPLVGALTLNSEVMELVPDTGQRLFIYSAEPDSPSDAALRLLAGLTAENAAEAESAEDAAQHAPSGQHSVRAHPLPRSDPADLSLDAMWVPRTAPVPRLGTNMPAQRIEQRRGHHRDRGDRYRGREADKLGYQLEQRRADSAAQYRSGRAVQCPPDHFACLCAHAGYAVEPRGLSRSP